MKKRIIKFLLKRPYFKGQYRLFNFFYKKGMLSGNEELVSPILGDFVIKCNPNTWVGAQIIYLGEYEDHIKKIFQKNIFSGNTVLDIGANIGFHTLFFSNLVGNKGSVIAFEPVVSNFKMLTENINSNKLNNISALNVALGHKNEVIYINASIDSSNPGAFNLFEEGETKILCKVGDDIINESRIDFIKIDVEGYEFFALQGLTKTIQKHQPKIVFEYDRVYQKKTGLEPLVIFDLLASFNYSFYEIKRDGVFSIPSLTQLNSADILAIPN